MARRKRAGRGRRRRRRRRGRKRSRGTRERIKMAGNLSCDERSGGRCNTREIDSGFSAK